MFSSQYEVIKEAKEMRCVCSYCQILYNLKPPYEDDSMTHGVCEECFSWLTGGREGKSNSNRGTIPEKEKRHERDTH